MSETSETVKSRAEVIAAHQRAKNDSGSPEVQVALLTQRIGYLTEHLSSHPKDRHSQRGMLNLIGRRKRLLAYLQRESNDRYRQTIDSLGLRK